VTTYQIDLYTMDRPHLADSLIIEAEDKVEAIEQARKDPRVVSGVLGLHSIFPVRTGA
jgi:uncharacterized protein YciI